MNWSKNAINAYQVDNCHMLSVLGHASVDLIYADYMFDNLDFSWIDLCHTALKDTGSIFVHSDYRSVCDAKFALDRVFGTGNFRNWIIWPYNWGGRSKRSFGRKHDDILWYSKGKDYRFYPEQVGIPKKTAGSEGFNPSGRDWQIPTDVWDDIGNFHTMAKERVKGADGRNVPFQKPERLIERIVLATTLPGDLVVDPFMGTGTTAMVCAKLERRFIGFEVDLKMFMIAYKRWQELVNDQDI